MAEEEEEMFSVLIDNNNYGTWCPSDKAIEMYYEQKPWCRHEQNPLCHEQNPWYRKQNPSGDLLRHDPVLIDIFRQLGPAFDKNKRSQTYEEKIPKKYMEYYSISYCDDGYERVVIDKEKYQLDQIIQTIHGILKKNISNDEKITDLTIWVDKMRGTKSA